MSRDALFAEVMRLPPSERVALALAVLEHTETDAVTDPAIEVAWDAELERRRRLIDSGEMRLVPWAEVRAELLADDSAESQHTPIRSAR